MPRRHSHLLALLVALFTALLTSCGGLTPAENSPPLPDGAGLLADSAAAMRTATSTRVGIDVEGELPGVPIKSAEGQLSKDGLAKGTASLDMGEQLYEIAFVITGADLYFRGPTGDFRKLSRSSAFLVYDPTVILDPKQGIAAALAAGTAAKTEAREQVGGVDSFRVQARFPGQSLDKLVPGFAQDSDSRVWIAADGFRLVQAQFPTTGGTLTFRFSDYDAPVDISAPI